MLNISILFVTHRFYGEIVCTFSDKRLHPHQRVKDAISENSFDLRRASDRTFLHGACLRDRRRCPRDELDHGSAISTHIHHGAAHIGCRDEVVGRSNRTSQRMAVQIDALREPKTAKLRLRLATDHTEALNGFTGSSAAFEFSPLFLN